jgi:hypothetical protein
MAQTLDDLLRFVANPPPGDPSLTADSGQIPVSMVSVGSTLSESGSTGDLVLVRSDGTVHRYTPARVNIRAWGAKCDGVTDDTNAWTNAVNALAASGATIETNGNSIITQLVIPDNSVDLSIVSSGSQHNGQNTACLTSSYAGSGPVLQAHGARGFHLQVSVVNTSPSFTGDLVDLQRGAASGDTTMCTVENCQLKAVAQAGSAVTLLRLTKVTTSRASGVYFYGGKYAIEGKVVNADYCNANTIERACYFSNQDVACIHNLGNDCTVSTAVFEALRGGAAGAYLQDATVGADDLHFYFCWTGDGNGTGTWYIVNGQGANADGTGTVNFFGGNIDPAGSGIKLNAATGQLNVFGVQFNTLTTAGVDCNSQTVTEAVVLGNNWRGMGTNIRIINTSGLTRLITDANTTGADDYQLFKAGSTQVKFLLKNGNQSAFFQLGTDGTPGLGNAGFGSLLSIGDPNDSWGTLAALVTPQAPKATPTYSSSITPDAHAGPWQTITVTNTTAFTINAPTNPPLSTRTAGLVIEILNSSGGTMGAITWNAAFILVGGAFTNPANTKKRYIRFQWNGANWVEMNRASADY